MNTKVRKNTENKTKKKNLFSRFYFLGSYRRGQAALSLVFLIGGIALLVSVTLSLVAINFLNSTFAFQNANKAMAAAMGGANDAILQLLRNPQFSSGGYSVCGNICATVTVSQGSGQATIISTATVFASQRKIQVVAAIDPSTGAVNTSSLQILTL